MNWLEKRMIRKDIRAELQQYTKKEEPAVVIKRRKSVAKK